MFDSLNHLVILIKMLLLRRVYICFDWFRVAIWNLIITITEMTHRSESVRSSSLWGRLGTDWRHTQALHPLPVHPPPGDNKVFAALDLAICKPEVNIFWAKLVDISNNLIHWHSGIRNGTARYAHDGSDPRLSQQMQGLSRSGEEPETSKRTILTIRT
jgi:hypothetical protein